jgi:predicted dehydrogenase
MADARVRIGVVGAGFMGRTYAHLIHDHPAAELAGVADVDAAAANAVAARYGCPAFSEAAALVETGELHGLIVATVEDAHRSPCLAALDGGIGVLVEKPLATTLEESQEIVAAAARSRTPLMVGHVLRFDARYALLRDAVQSGQIGDPAYVYARRHNGANAQDRLRGRCSLPLFLGVHDYDAVRWTLGREVVAVRADERRGLLAGQGYPIADLVVAVLTFDDGTLATVEEGWILPAGHPAGFDQRLDVHGSRGLVELAGGHAGLTVTTGDGAAWPDTALWPTVHGRPMGALARQADHFIACLRSGQEPLVTGDDGLAAVRIALAVEEAARTGATVELRTP